MATEIPRGWGGVQKEAISEGVGGCYRGLFPGGLSDHEIGKLLINNSSVEKAVSYLLLPVFENKYYNLFALINFYLWSTKINAIFESVRIKVGFCETAHLPLS